MSNKNTQKKSNGGGTQQQRGKPKDTSIENITEATAKKIEKIKTVTNWQVSEDIFNLLRECNFDEALTIDKILSGDAGHPGEQWTEVTRPRKHKEPQPTEVPQQADRRPANKEQQKQNRGRPTGGRGGRPNGQQSGAKRTPHRPQQGKRPGSEGRVVPQDGRDMAPSSSPSSAPTAQPHPSTPSTHSPPSRGAPTQRPQNNGLRPAGRDQSRGAPLKRQPQSHTQGQVHVHSQAQPQGQQMSHTSPQAQLRDQSAVLQEHVLREPERQAPQRVEAVVPAVEQSPPKIQLEETTSQSQHQVQQQTQQAHAGQGHERGHAQLRTQPPVKKAPGKGQYSQPGTKGRRSENFVWQAKEASTSPSQGATNRSHSPQNLRSSPEPQIVRQSSPSQSLNVSLSNEEPQVEKAAVILPSDLNAYDGDTDGGLNLHFGNFGTPSAPKVDVLPRQTPSAVGRPPVARPVATPSAKETKDSVPVSSAQSASAVSQPVQPRKPAAHQEKPKQPPQQPTQQPLRTAPTGMGMDSGLNDDLSFGQQNPHMMNPQTFSSYNPGHFHSLPFPAFALSDMDPANPLPHHSQMNYYDPQAYSQASAYRASSPHQGDISPKFQGQYREPKYPQQASQASSSPVQDRHDKHRQESGSPPPRGGASHTQQGHPQSPQSPPPGQHPSQPPLPYSMPTSQYPQLYGYPYQYSYPAASSQFTPGFSRYPVHYPKHFPNLSTTSSGGYPLSPPTSSGYPEEMLAGDYSKSYMPAVMQSFFHGMPDPATSGAPTHMNIGGKAQTTHTPPSSTTPHVNPNSDMAPTMPYKDYPTAELRGPSAGTYYKGGYAGQPSAHHAPQSQFGGQQAQYGQQTGQYQGNGQQGQFPFMHHQPHPHHLMQGQQQSQQQSSTLSPQGQGSFP